VAGLLRRYHPTRTFVAHYYLRDTFTAVGFCDCLLKPACNALRCDATACRDTKALSPFSRFDYEPSLRVTTATVPRHFHAAFRRILTRYLSRFTAGVRAILALHITYAEHRYRLFCRAAPAFRRRAPPHTTKSYGDAPVPWLTARGADG